MYVLPVGCGGSEGFSLPFGHSPPVNAARSSPKYSINAIMTPMLSIPIKTGIINRSYQDSPPSIHIAKSPDTRITGKEKKHAPKIPRKQYHANSTRKNNRRNGNMRTSRNVIIAPPRQPCSCLKKTHNIITLTCKIRQALIRKIGPSLRPMLTDSLEGVQKSVITIAGTSAAVPRLACRFQPHTHMHMADQSAWSIGDSRPHHCSSNCNRAVD